MESRALMKSMREGCLNSEKGLILPTGPTINGDPERDADGTEIMGEIAAKGLKLHAAS